MDEWLWWLLGSVCGLLAAVQMLGGLWCLVELYRKWRGAAELWGLDWLDIVFRLEHAFGVSLTDADFADFSPEARGALTAGQLWEAVVARIRVSGRELPADGWDRLVMVLSESLHVKTSRIEPDARLFADLGMLQGFD